MKKSVFDTRFDTKKIFVSAKNRFSLRTYIGKDGKSLIYLDVNDGKTRIRLNTEIYILPEIWDQKKQRIKNSKDSAAFNLILENIEAKIITIKTSYILQERALDAKTLVEEFQSNTPEFDFISFFRHHLEINKSSLKSQTIKNHTSVLHKLEKFMPEIPFHKIDSKFFAGYKKYYNENKEITYQSDLKTIKPYLRLAVKQGIRIGIQLDEIKVNVESKRIIYLSPIEMQTLIKYYFNDFVQPSHRNPLGYFLISCYTGMRVSDIKERNRKELLGGIFNFNHKKTENTQSMKLNDDAKKILLHNESLFDEIIVEQTINKELKKIANLCNIDKKITMHVGRHTFATAAYRNTRDVFLVKKLLGHSNIRHTMVYVHLVDGEELDVIDAIKF